MPSSLVRSRSTRRTATVTTSAPEASMARDHLCVVAVLAGADEEAGAEALAADVEGRFGRVARGGAEGVGHGEKDNGEAPTRRRRNAPAR